MRGMALFVGVVFLCAITSAQAQPYDPYYGPPPGYGPPPYYGPSYPYGPPPPRRMAEPDIRKCPTCGRNMVRQRKFVPGVGWVWVYICLFCE